MGNHDKHVKNSYLTDPPMTVIPIGKSHITLSKNFSSEEYIINPRYTPGINLKDNLISSIESPIGCPPLHELLKPNASICLLVEDITRPGPKKEILTILITYLAKHGIKNNNITIIFARGLHRRHSRSEWIQMIGEKIVEQYRVMDHEPHDQSRLIFIGETSRGTPVEINKFVCESDLIIGVSYLGIHDFAGYTGGGKIILPGVASEKAIKKNHILSLDERSLPGIADGNPARMDMEEAAEILGYHFSINVPLNYRGEPVGVFSGHFVKAHRCGVPVTDEMYKIPLKDKAELVIVSAGGFPHDINLYQAERSIRYSSRVLVEGGTLILVADCIDGIGNRDMQKTIKDYRGDPDNIRDELLKDYSIGKWVAWDLLQNSEKYDIFIVSENLDPRVFSQTRIKIFQRIENALKLAYSKHGFSPKYLVIHYGNITLPWVPNCRLYKA